MVKSNTSVVKSKKKTFTYLLSEGWNKKTNSQTHKQIHRLSDSIG